MTNRLKRYIRATAFIVFSAWAMAQAEGLVYGQGHIERLDLASAQLVIDDISLRLADDTKIKSSAGTVVSKYQLRKGQKVVWATLPRSSILREVQIVHKFEMPKE